MAHKQTEVRAINEPDPPDNLPAGDGTPRNGLLSAPNPAEPNFLPITERSRKGFKAYPSTIIGTQSILNPHRRNATAMGRSAWRGTLLVVCLAVMLVAFVPGVAAAQSGVGGSVTVERGETVSGVTGAYGTIVVEGTVDGDISGLAGNIIIREDGIVEGDLEAAAGNVRIAGTVRGDVSTGSGSVHLTETGVVEGQFRVGAGTVRIDGTVGGDAEVGAETIRLGEDASIAGSLTYDGRLEGARDAVQGEITRDRSLGPDIVADFGPIATWAFAINAFLLNLFLGVVLLGLFPNASDRIAGRVTTRPARSGLIGLGVLLGGPILLVATAITVVGIPIAVAGVFAFLLLVWIGTVYGRFAVGTWLLSLAAVDNRWAGLLVGLVLAVLLWQIPIVGGLLNVGIFLLGLGAVVGTLVARRREVESAPAESPAE